MFRKLILITFLVGFLLPAHNQESTEQKLLTLTEVLELARDQSQPDLVPLIERHLDSYRSGKPLRVNWDVPPP